ncbi:MAG: hypothetical protein CMH27_10915 [Micavibrio sp.]|nr:hypothetical protein [Micavibrio sp.]|tara:strand:- start:4968 stop:5408 length:441 start_codon:yes stop_codon:yes gene_type:complete
MNNFKQWLSEQSKMTLVFAGAVIGGLFFIVFLNPRNSDFYIAAGQEVALAKQICIESRAYVQREPRRLKLGQNILDDIPVNGSVPKLRYVGYPRVMFMHNGYGHKSSQKEFYCTFTDPRGANKSGSSHYFYDYNTGNWVERTRTRR